MPAEMFIEMAAETERHLRWLRALKSWENWTKAAEDRLNGKLQNLFGNVMEKTIEELLRRGIIPSNDANVQTLLYDFRQLRDPFQKIIKDADIEAAGVGRLRAFQDLNRIGTALTFSAFSTQMLKLIENHSFVASNSTMNRLTGDVMANLAESFKKGLGITEAAESLKRVFQGMHDWELRRVARTEINGFQSMGSFLSLEELNVTYIQWWTALDPRVRDSHAAIHGQIVIRGDHFSNGLRYPGDRDGRIEQWINCRCRLVPFLMPPGYMQPGMAYFWEDDLIPIEYEIEEAPSLNFIGEAFMVNVMGGGISETYVGYIDNEKYMLKVIQPGSYVVVKNPECELLATEIFHKFGIAAPNARYGMVKLPNGDVVEMMVTDFVENAYSADLAMDRISGGLLTLDETDFRKMQVLDVLIGNGDRHNANFFISQDGKVIPIDNDLSFITPSVGSPDSTWQQCFTDSLDGLEIHQTPAHIMERNSMGRDILTKSTSSDYLGLVEEVKGMVTPDFIQEVIEKLPASVERKADLLRILTWRCDNLESLILSALRHYGIS